MLESGWRMQAVGMALRCEVRVHVRRLGAARAEHFLLAPSEEGFDAAQKRGAGAQNAASHDRDFARCNQGGPRNGRTGGHRCDFEALDGFPGPPGGEGADGADGRAGCEHRSPSSEGSSDGNGGEAANGQSGAARDTSSHGVLLSEMPCSLEPLFASAVSAREPNTVAISDHLAPWLGTGPRSRRVWGAAYCPAIESTRGPRTPGAVREVVAR